MKPLIASSAGFAGLGRYVAIGILVIGASAGCGGAADQGLFDVGSAGVGQGGAGGSADAGTGSGGSGAGGTSTGGTSTGGTSTGGSGAGGTSTGGTSTGGTSTGGTSTGGAGGAPTCGDSCTNGGFDCCGPQCVNFKNDFKNCGKCGVNCVANGFTPYCVEGQCGHQPDCWADEPCAGGDCCGFECCDLGQLCCNIPGPIERGPTCTPPTETGTCPLGCLNCACTSPGTLIATPAGERPISDLKVGDLVYSVHQGDLRAVPILVAHRELVTQHAVLRIELDDGRRLEVSGPHPTADGRLFDDLVVGGQLDGKTILSTQRIPYGHSHTHDILPASDSGTYFADGARIGSSLSPQGANSCNPAELPR